MLRRVHALMEDTVNAHKAAEHPVVEDVRTNRIEETCLRESAAGVAEGRISLQCFECLIELVAVNELLLVALALARVAQDDAKVPLRLARKTESVLSPRRHPGPSARCSTCPCAPAPAGCPSAQA